MCLTEQGEEEGAAWLESAGCAKEGDRDGRTVGDGGGKRGWAGLGGKGLRERGETHMALRWVLRWTVGVKDPEIFPPPQP